MNNYYDKKLENGKDCLVLEIQFDKNNVKQDINSYVPGESKEVFLKLMKESAAIYIEMYVENELVKYKDKDLENNFSKEKIEERLIKCLENL